MENGVYLRAKKFMKSMQTCKNAQQILHAASKLIHSMENKKVKILLLFIDGITGINFLQSNTCMHWCSPKQRSMDKRRHSRAETAPCRHQTLSSKALQTLQRPATNSQQITKFQDLNFKKTAQLKGIKTPGYFILSTFTSISKINKVRANQQNIGTRIVSNSLTQYP